jgi:acyl-CoA synthetase (AMP-forming)/AMP-acid ligase II
MCIYYNRESTEARPSNTPSYLPFTMPIAISQDQPGNQFHFSSITEMVEVRARETPDFPIIAVPDRNFQFHRYTYRDIDNGANRLAHHYTSLGVKPRSRGDAESSIVTAMLAPSSIDYAINELAFAKMGKQDIETTHHTEILTTVLSAGHTTLFLSTNNSVPALTHLLKATGTTTLVAHPSLLTNAKDAIAELAQDAANQSCQLIDIADKALWDNDESVKPYPRALTPEQEGPLPVFIVHSSGSTGFPKVSSASRISAIQWLTVLHRSLSFYRTKRQPTTSPALDSAYRPLRHCRYTTITVVRLSFLRHVLSTSTHVFVSSRLVLLPSHSWTQTSVSLPVRTPSHHLKYYRSTRKRRPYRGLLCCPVRSKIAGRI